MGIENTYIETKYLDFFFFSAKCEKLRKVKDMVFLKKVRMRRVIGVLNVLIFDSSSNVKNKKINRLNLTIPQNKIYFYPDFRRVMCFCLV